MQVEVVAAGDLAMGLVQVALAAMVVEGRVVKQLPVQMAPLIQVAVAAVAGMVLEIIMAEPADLAL